VNKNDIISVANKYLNTKHSTTILGSDKNKTIFQNNNWNIE